MSGDSAKALDLQDRLMPLHKAIFIEPGLSGAKYALSKLGKVENVVRSPLVTIEASTAEKIDHGDEACRLDKLGMRRHLSTS